MFFVKSNQRGVFSNSARRVFNSSISHSSKRISKPPLLYLKSAAAQGGKMGHPGQRAAVDKFPFSPQHDSRKRRAPPGAPGMEGRKIDNACSWGRTGRSVPAPKSTWRLRFRLSCPENLRKKRNLFPVRNAAGHGFSVFTVPATWTAQSRSAYCISISRRNVAAWSYRPSLTSVRAALYRACAASGRSSG